MDYFNEGVVSVNPRLLKVDCFWILIAKQLVWVRFGLLTNDHLVWFTPGQALSCRSCRHLRAFMSLETSKHVVKILPKQPNLQIQTILLAILLSAERKQANN